MNLLRFFCGIETGRISPPKDQFEAIEADYARLCSQFVGCKEHMITLMNEAVDKCPTHPSTTVGIDSGGKDMLYLYCSKRTEKLKYGG
jgi:hypothetical protein